MQLFCAKNNHGLCIVDLATAIGICCWLPDTAVARAGRACTEPRIEEPDHLDRPLDLLDRHPGPPDWPVILPIGPLTLAIGKLAKWECDGKQASRQPKPGRQANSARASGGN